MSRRTIADADKEIESLKNTIAMQAKAISVLTQQRNETYIEQANKLAMLLVNKKEGE